MFLCKTTILFSMQKDQVRVYDLNDLKFSSVMIGAHSSGSVTTSQRLVLRNLSHMLFWIWNEFKDLFINLRFGLGIFSGKGVNRHLHIGLLVELLGLMNLCNLETAGKHPTQK